MRGAFSVVVVLVLAAIIAWAWMVWQSPEIRDVPATETPTPRAVAVFTVTPESLFRATATATVMPDVFTVGTPTPGDLLPMTPSTRVIPTATATATVAPAPAQVPIQKG